MKTASKWMYLLFVVLFAGGCATQNGVKKVNQQEMRSKNYLDVANDFMIEMSGFWTLGMGTLEYTGDKTEDVTRFLGDVYQSL